MHQGLRWAFGVVAFSALLAGEARAQYYYPRGYGGYGWGGWGGGGTVQGSIAQGMGYYAMGLGAYNRQTAIANSINVNTIMQWNEFMFLSQQEANERERLRLAHRQQLVNQTADSIYKRLRDNPTPSDVNDGDALNVVLDQMTDPKVLHGSALRLLTDPVSSTAVRNIPFTHASDAVTISLQKVTAKDAWPLALAGQDFEPERLAYQKAVARALDEDAKGELSAAMVQTVQAAASALRRKLEAAPPTDRLQFSEAENYVKALVGMSRMLEKPQVDQVLAELEKTKSRSTTLGSLIAFMHNYNLRFGVAQSPEARAVYQNLYPMLTAARDKMMKEAAGGDNAQASNLKGKPTDFFQGMHLDHLEGKNKDNEGAAP